MHKEGETMHVDVEWVVNDLAELGVKIGDQFFFLYKGHSCQGGRKWRYVGKREFGECCHPWFAIKQRTGKEILPDNYVGFHGEEESVWQDLPWKGEEDVMEEDVMEWANMMRMHLVKVSTS